MDSYANLQKISQENALNLAQFFIRSGKNFLLFGRSGVGKTEIILQAIKECKFKVNYINLSVMERCDLGGYPNINAVCDVITFKYPHFLPRLEDGGKPDTVWLFDEVDKCSPETTAPLLEILQFRKINGIPLNIMACALTGNLINENAYSNRISSALIDRTAKYILEFDFNIWIDWAKANNVHDLILGFLQHNQEFACGKIEDTYFAGPSPRGWVMVSDAITKAYQFLFKDIETITHIVSGYVGFEAGLRFKIWFDFYRKFEPIVFSMIEKGSSNFDFESLSKTEQIVFVIAACYYAKQKTLSTSKSKNKFVYLQNLCKFFNSYMVDEEMLVVGLCNSFGFDLITKHKLYECKEFFDIFTKINQGVIIRK
jgi:hypothetical protein